MHEGIVREHGDRVYRFIRRLVGPAWADDLTQDTFLRALRALPKYRGGDQVSWLFSIANGVCIDFIRRQDTGARKLEFLSREPQSTPEPIDLLAQSEEQERLREAIARLPLEQRQVFLLREESGMTFREIADMLEAPLGTVLARMHAAIQVLKKKCQGRLETYELRQVQG